MHPPTPLTKVSCIKVKISDIFPERKTSREEIPGAAESYSGTIRGLPGGAN